MYVSSSVRESILYTATNAKRRKYQWQELETVKHKGHMEYKKTYSTKSDDIKNQLYPESAISKGYDQN